MDFLNMTMQQLIDAVPAEMQKLRESLPIEKRHEFNVVEQKVKQAIAAGDMSAILDLQKQYGVHNPTGL